MADRWRCSGCLRFTRDPESEDGRGWHCDSCGCPKFERVQPRHGRKPRREVQPDPARELAACAELAETVRMATADRDRGICAAYRAGFGIREIGRAVGLAAPSVQHILRRDGAQAITTTGETIDEAF